MATTASMLAKLTADIAPFTLPCMLSCFIIKLCCAILRAFSIASRALLCALGCIGLHKGLQVAGHTGVLTCKALSIHLLGDLARGEALVSHHALLNHLHKPFEVAPAKAAGIPMSI